jgi:hypothetical protein
MTTKGWTPGEAAAVNEFLNSPLGVKWLGVLFNRSPKIDISTTERTAMTGAAHAGYEYVFNVIAETRSTIALDDPGTKPIDTTKD